MARVPFIVVTDRGIVKAYEVRQTPKHGTAARLVMESKLQEAHERYRDKVTDQAGAFPSTGSNGHANAIAERPKMEAEEDTRLFKSVAWQVKTVIRQHQPVSWSFAAPAEINSAIFGCSFSPPNPLVVKKDDFCVEAEPRYRLGVAVWRSCPPVI
jgi:hypothetical protein